MSFEDDKISKTSLNCPLYSSLTRLLLRRRLLTSIILKNIYINLRRSTHEIEIVLILNLMLLTFFSFSSIGDDFFLFAN